MWVAAGDGISCVGKQLHAFRALRSHSIAPRAIWKAHGRWLEAPTRFRRPIVQPQVRAPPHRVMVMTYQVELTDERMDFRPGTRVPADGAYQRVNVFGSPAGGYVPLTEGQKFPELARGWAWRLAGLSQDHG